MKRNTIIILINLNSLFAYRILNLNEIKYNTHLEYEKIKKVCSEIGVICNSNDTNVCAVRYTRDKMEYKDFLNSCYLYIGNMCDNPGQEFAIIVTGSCRDYLKTRRRTALKAPIVSSENKTEQVYNARRDGAGTIDKVNSTKKYLRGKVETTLSTLYDIETAFDEHHCPMSCPNTYNPVCIAVNRGHGLYFKFYTFVNHCAGDLYYCKNWEEFSPPPDESELVKSSPLSWSYCASNKYIQYARFSEVTSSMGYYGWLAGDYKYSHIMEPHERIPGYG